MTRYHDGVAPITDVEFRLLRDLVQRESGIQLPDAKRSLLVGRLGKRVRALDLPTFGAYYRYVMDRPAADELVQLLNCICTNETRFFREPKQFAFLDEVVFPEWYAQARIGRRPKRVRAWSAACSTGEEAYSLAMVLLEHFPPADGWRVEIMASDLSTRALERARAGVWSVEQAKHIPHRYLKRFMRRGTRAHQGKMRAGAEVRAVTTFKRLNLQAASYADVGCCDLVLCRNVLMYFSAETRAAVVSRLLSHLAPSGYLFVGHAESLARVSGQVRTVHPTIYRPVAGVDRPFGSAPLAVG